MGLEHQAVQESAKGHRWRCFPPMAFGIVVVRRRALNLNEEALVLRLYGLVVAEGLVSDDHDSPQY
jgi:hypothetical protein